MSNIKRETFFLYIVQLSNMALPLLLVPYLTSTLGAEYFGKLSYAQVVNMLAMFFVDFGFNLSAARYIGINLSNKIRLKKAFVNVQFVKFIIFLCINVAGLAFVPLIHQQPIDNKILIVGILCSISSILTPAWFFQGIGKNSVLAVTNFFTRIASLILTICFVKTQGDIMLAIYFQLLSPAIAGLISILFLWKMNIIEMNFRFFSLKFCREMFGESIHNFLASFLTLGFTYFNPLLIKYFLGDSALGIYSLADKLVNILRQLYSPLVQANFSSMCQFFKNGELTLARNRALKVFYFFSLLSGLAIVTNLIFGEYFIYRFFAAKYS
ncbi:oligosaccharide flippase family protein, partial [Rosenbergiella collisarenosi]|uniref:oligosaccharide flippase family protein n=1 Tax=Rosenbergiella collisarenosi TaxID=1544695 RepID=UPI001F4E7183